MLPRRTLTALAVLLCLVVLVAGCRRRRRGGDTIVTSSGDIFTTDEFPGQPVQNGNVADDARAMSPSGMDFNDGLKLTFNGTRNQAMLTYIADGAPFAHFFDGVNWTPPISLGAVDAQMNGTVNGRQIVHAFLNTGNHPNPDARERDGDCLIFWSAPDADGDGGSVADDVNRCLFVTYFDTTFRADPAHRYGFQQFATRVNSQDEFDEDVETFGVASDGIVGEAGWGPNRNDLKWGDETTSIVAFWHQRENCDGFVGAEDRATWFAWFDLGPAGDDELPLAPGAATRIATLDFGASDVAPDANETLVDDRYVTYNNVLFMRCGSDDAGSGSDGVLGRIRFNRNFLDDNVQLDDDITLQTTSFDLATGSRSATLSLHDTAPSATDATENTAEFIREDGGFFRGRHIFGSDEGIACLVFPFVQLVQDPNGDFSDIANDGRLTIAEIDEATGAILGDLNLDLEQGTTNDSVDEGDVDCRLSRNGDYLWFAWRERSEAGLADDDALWVAQFLTTRPDADGLFVLPTIGDATSGTFQASVDTDFESVTWFSFQASLTYVCGAQSDPDVMNIFFQQSDGTNDEVFVSRLDADLVSAPVVPIVATSSVEIFEDLVQSVVGNVINDEGIHFRANDSGEGGNFIAFYVEDIDPTGFDLRLFAERTGAGSGVVEIDSAVSHRQVPMGVQLKVISTPKGDTIGAFDIVSGVDSEDRPHAPELVHVFFQENESTEDSGLGFALRTRRFRALDDGTPLGDLFFPNAGTAFQPPFDLDLPGADPNTADDADFIAVESDGLVVGLWFQELSHLYYQEFNVPKASEDGIGWRTDDDLSDPFLIDDDNDEDVQNFIALRRPTDSCESLEGAVIFWTKAYGSGSGGGLSERLQVRVLNGPD